MEKAELKKKLLEELENIKKLKPGEPHEEIDKMIWRNSIVIDGKISNEFRNGFILGYLSGLEEVVIELEIMK